MVHYQATALPDNVALQLNNSNDYNHQRLLLILLIDIDHCAISGHFHSGIADVQANLPVARLSFTLHFD